MAFADHGGRTNQNGGAGEGGPHSAYLVLGALWQIDLTIDGADEVERETLATPIVAGSTIFGTKDYKAVIAAIRANAGAGAAKQAMSRAPAACRAVGSFSPPSTSITGSRPRCAHNRPLRVPEDRFEQIPMTGAPSPLRCHAGNVPHELRSDRRQRDREREDLDHGASCESESRKRPCSGLP